MSFKKKKKKIEAEVESLKAHVEHLNSAVMAWKIRYNNLDGVNSKNQSYIIDLESKLHSKDGLKIDDRFIVKYSNNKVLTYILEVPEIEDPNALTFWYCNICDTRVTLDEMNRHAQEWHKTMHYLVATAFGHGLGVGRK